MTQASKRDVHLGESIDPAELDITLRVLASIHQLPEDHPDFRAVRRATASMF